MFPFAELAWLPSAPADFGGQIKQLRQSEGDTARALRELAGYALDADQLHKLSRLFYHAREDGQPLAGLIPFRLGIITNSTPDFIIPAVIGSGLRYGLAIDCVTCDYGQMMQTALDPASAINSAGCDAVLLAVDGHGLTVGAAPGDTAGAHAAVDRASAQIDAMAQALNKHSPCVILQTVPPPAESMLGSFDALLPGSDLGQFDAFNRALIGRAVQGPARMFDVAALAARVGLAHWHDPIAWNMAKQPFSHGLIPLYADALCRIIAAIRGKSRKALVLDLDNTLWAGVIGDDGMAGINLAQGDATGEAHLALQRYALAMRERGIVLAISSKNTDEVARQVFREHPDMLLREDHIAVFQANWDDKASNLIAIADALSIGLDALVFVDDNPAERALVRQKLPQVAVPELPTDPALFVRVVAAAGYFEAAAFSDEDRRRADYYADNAQRVALQSSSGDIDDYLRSLAMTIRFAPFDEPGRARITQLINKSNQFNLTTRRYTEGEIAELIGRGDVLTLQVRLEDTFGDNGMISAVICRLIGEDWEIDTWLMSCRVLGRRVEQAVLSQLIRMAAARGASRLIGIYRPSERNGIVAQHYAKLGFALEQTKSDGAQVWALKVAQPLDNEGQSLFSAVYADGFDD